MDKELKTKWVAALRSDKFGQITGKLHEPGSTNYCCLGVLCRVAELPIDAGGFSTIGYDPFYDLLGKKATGDLWHMNDGGRSFREIADHIEKNL